MFAQISRLYMLKITNLRNFLQTLWTSSEAEPAAAAGHADAAPAAEEKAEQPAAAEVPKAEE